MCKIYWKIFIFYKVLLNKEPLYYNEDHWITFDCGNYLSLYNKQYDLNLIENKLDHNNFNQEYIETLLQEETKYNDIVVFNFEVGDLAKEYQRLKDLQIECVM